MDGEGETQQHLQVGQDAVLSSTRTESATPGTEVNTDMVETTRRLEQSYILPTQPNEEARTVLEDAAASLARTKPLASVGYDALKKVFFSTAARSKGLLLRLCQTCAKKTRDQAPNFIMGGIRVLLFPDIDLAFAIKLIVSALRNPSEVSHIVDSFLAAKIPWLRLFIVQCYYTILATLPYVLIIWIQSASPVTGVPDALGRRSLLMIALILFLWIGYTAVMLKVPAPKAY